MRVAVADAVAIARLGVAESLTVPAPRGWNAKDPEDRMEPDVARELINWIPEGRSCRTRKGNVEHSDTEESGDVETLVEYKSGTVNKLLAAVSGKIFDVTTDSASSLATGFSVDRWQTTNHAGFTWFVNGTDTPQKFNGSTIAAFGFTGVGLTVTDLINVIAFKGRLYFVEQDTASFWYSETAAVTGVLAEFDLATVGGGIDGRLIAIETITHDGGLGVDDIIAFFFDSGKVAIYQGDDPGTAADWSLVGIYVIGAPLGHRAVRKVGADIIVITQEGYAPLSKVLPLGHVVTTGQRFSDDIENAVSDAIVNFGATTGWEVFSYPRGKWLIFNVPVAADVYQQHVLNTRSGGWFLITGWNARQFSRLGQDLYFGGAGGKVFKADSGFTDDGAAIVAKAKTAWNYFEDRTRTKQWSTFRPILKSVSRASISYRLATDFDDLGANSTLNLPGQTSLSRLGTARWGTARWSGLGEVLTKEWRGISGEGYAASLIVEVSSSTQQIVWLTTGYIYQFGGLLT